MEWGLATLENMPFWLESLKHSPSGDLDGPDHAGLSEVLKTWIIWVPKCVQGSISWLDW